MTLWLIGMMGSGKTTVGRLVADAIGLEFIDTDAAITDATGRAIADLVNADEPHFRSAEKDVVESIAGRDAVVATGGGVGADLELSAVMRRTGLVVLLTAPVEVLSDRVGRGDGRPLLGSDTSGDLERLLLARAIRYRSAAHVVVDASTAPGTVAEAVVAAWEEWR